MDHDHDEGRSLIDRVKDAFGMGSEHDDHAAEPSVKDRADAGPQATTYGTEPADDSAAGAGIGGAAGSSVDTYVGSDTDQAPYGAESGTLTGSATTERAGVSDTEYLGGAAGRTVGDETSGYGSEGGVGPSDPTLGEGDPALSPARDVDEGETPSHADRFDADRNV